MTRARDIANFGDGITTADIGDGQITAGKLSSTLDLSGKTVTLPAGVAGITEWDAWRTTANAGLSSGDVVGNQSEGWERFDNAIFSKGGTGLSQSSGVWTFPSTGYWLIDGKFTITSGGTRNYMAIQIQGTTDNGSNWDTLANNYAHQEAGQYMVSDCSYIVNITNTATHKIRFRASFQNDATVEGNTTFYYSGFQAIKIAGA